MIVGATYSAYLRRFWAAGTARQFYVAIYWYAAGNAFISASIGASVSSGSGVWTSSSVVTAVAPATTVAALIAVVVLATAAAGEIFYASEFCLAPGVITDYIEP